MQSIENQLRDIQKEYCKRIPKQAMNDIIKIAKTDNRLIHIIETARQYNKNGHQHLSDYVYDFIKENNYDRKYGHWLYYLCFIYLHPLTKVQVLASTCDRVLKENNINFRWI